MNTRFGRAFRYEVRNYFRAVAILWLVMALIPAAMLAITYFLAGETAMEGSFNGYSIAVGMFGLVLGMVGLRENQRVLNQNGVSRRSAFLADRDGVLSALMFAVALAVAAVLVAAGVTVIMGAYQTVLGGQGRLLITDLYQVIYEGPSAGAGIGGLVRGAIFSAAVGWMLAALGQFCSALYWRLNKFWTILISVTVPLVLIFGSVPLISWLGTTSAGRAAVEALAAFGQFLAASPWNAAAVLLAMGAAFFALSWLLLRRAMIRPAK